jgi:hypothetical protein
MKAIVTQPLNLSIFKMPATFLLAACLCFTCLPNSAFAQQDSPDGYSSGWDTEHEWGFDKRLKKWSSRFKNRKASRWQWGGYNPAQPVVYTSFTQEFYGNPRETACTPDGQNLSSLEIMTMSMGNMPFQTLFFGYLSTEKYFYAYQSEAAKLQALLPGRGRSELISGIYSVDYNTPLNRGKIANDLLAQTITLALNMNLSAAKPLEDFPLEAGRWLVTQKKDQRSSCGNPIPQPCGYGFSYGWFGNSYRAINSWRIPAKIVQALGEDKTVWGLFCLAGYSLAGLPLPEGISLRDIAESVENINAAFEDGRFFIGWSDRQVNCSNYWWYKYTAAHPLTLPGETNTAANLARVGTKDVSGAPVVGQVRAYPNPFSQKLQFQVNAAEDGLMMVEIFTITGQRLATLYKGNMKKGESRVMEYTPARALNAMLIYRITTNRSTYSGKLQQVQQ